MALITGSWATDILSITLGLITLLYFYLTSTFNYWKKRNVKYEPGAYPFLGNFYDVFFFKKNLGEYFGDMYRKNPTERIFGFFILRRPFLLLRDPELIKCVLIKDFQHFASRSSYVNEQDTVGSGNLFTQKGANWKYTRNKLNPLYSSGKIKQMFPLMAKVGEELNKNLHAGHGDGNETPEEVRDLCAKYTTDLLVSTAFGVEANSLNDPNSIFRTAGKTIFTYSLHRIYELLAFFFFPPIAKLMNAKLFSEMATCFLRQMFWQTMNAREESKMFRGDVIDALIQLKNKGSAGDEKSTIAAPPGLKLEGDFLVAQAALFFAAGFETSSSTMSFTLYELALNPDIQTKLREEIYKILGSGKIEYETVTESKYLENCIRETLRLYPALPYLDRECTIPYTFPGTNVTIDKNVAVVIPLDGIQKDEKYYPNPKQYDPDRWSRDEMTPCTFLPFGDGPHNCIGQRFGYLSIKIGLIHILKDFEVYRHKETPVPLVLDKKAFVLAIKEGIKLGIRPVKK